MNILCIKWLSPPLLVGLNYCIPSLNWSIGSLNQTAFPLIWLIGNNEYLDDKCSLSNMNEIAGNTNNNLSCCILLVPIRACWVLFSPVGSWCVLSILVGLFLLLFGSGSISMSYLWYEYVGTMFFSLQKLNRISQSEENVRNLNNCQMISNNISILEKNIYLENQTSNSAWVVKWKENR